MHNAELSCTIWIIIARATFAFAVACDLIAHPYKKGIFLLKNNFLKEEETLNRKQYNVFVIEKFQLEIKSGAIAISLV